MKDNLQDLVQHTLDLQCVDLVKIEGTATETLIHGIAEDRSVVIRGKFLNKIDDFEGVFGMPNMGTLKTILGIDEYKDNAVITIKSDAVKGPVGMNFKNAAGDFTNDYRFMAKEIVEDKLRTVKFKGVNWHVEVEPTMAAIMRLKSMASANPEEKTFVMKTDDGDLKCYFGDHSTHAGNFVFQADVEGELKRAWHWPVQHVINILSLNGDKTMRISDDGATEITVNSGIAEYSYVMPAQSK
ncbi:MAG: hypothetical protein KAI17_20490 [Thiotrichaceae bacterium]|nr:hypothetical protein [Thiotrichaceae bacterium]